MLKINPLANQANTLKVKQTNESSVVDREQPLEAGHLVQSWDPGRSRGWVGAGPPPSPARSWLLPHKVLHYLLAQQSGRPRTLSSGIQYGKVTTTNVGVSVQANTNTSF